jgi:hypothetical protein
VQQSLVFGPAVGVSSPKAVSATATATWGAAASVQSVIPLTLAEGSELAKCTASSSGGQPVIGATCKLFWDAGDSANGKWGIIDLRQVYWGTDANAQAGCNKNGSAALVNGQPNDPTSGWMGSPVSGSWITSTPTSPNAYVYACAADGGQGSDLTNAVNGKVAFPTKDIVYMPVFRPSANVYSNGGDVYKYAIVGFAGLRVVKAYQGNSPDKDDGLNAWTACGVAGSGGNARCLIASWQGFQTGGLTLGGNGDFGVKAVGITQ